MCKQQREKLVQGNNLIVKLYCLTDEVLQIYTLLLTSQAQAFWELVLALSRKGCFNLEKH